MGDKVSPEQEYVKSVEAVIKMIQATEASSEVVMVFAQIWAQHKAGELTALNVVRGQMESPDEDSEQAIDELKANINSLRWDIRGIRHEQKMLEDSLRKAGRGNP